MSWLYFDCFSGISGDMTLGALVDIGVPPDHLRDELAKLHLQGYELQFSRRMVGVFDASKVDVLLHHELAHGHEHSHDHAHSHDHDHDHSHDHHHDHSYIHHHDHDHAHAHDHEHSHEHSHEHHHDHDHDHHHDHSHDHHHDHGHGHDHAHDHAHGHDHDHRSYRDIKALIESSALGEGVKQRALAIFARLAMAEGAAHGMPPEDVSFHEVGAIDSIVDIVGAAIGLEYLGVTRVISAPLPLGRGFVRCQHGRIPVPAPATVKILEGVPVQGTELPYEMVTPTGAAIIAALAESYGGVPSFVLERVGYGAGTRTLPDRPNLLRLMLGRPHDNKSQSADCMQLETNLDDMTPEVLAYVVEQLLEAGAKDVWTTPITMKKGRLAHKLSALCAPPLLPTLASIVFRESSTFGVRYFPVSRQMLTREIVPVETPFGAIGVKVGRDEGALRTFAPEFEDCRRQAAAHQVPLKEVYAAAIRAWQTLEER